MTFPAKAYQRTPEPGNPARSEAWALLEAARQLNQTKDGPIDAFRAALRANWRLWTIFQASLIEPDCALPTELRSNLLGLANFIDKQTVELLAERDSAKIDALININRQISEGLMEGARASAAQSAAAPAAPSPTPGSAATGPVRRTA
jgi:flagellar biosynthesis activator protein FlaF